MSKRIKLTDCVRGRISDSKNNTQNSRSAGFISELTKGLKDKYLYKGKDYLFISSPLHEDIESWNVYAVDQFKAGFKDIGVTDFDWVDKYNATQSLYETPFQMKKVEIEENYVYALLNKRSGRIFYIGRGTRLRLEDHTKEKKERAKNDYIAQIGTNNVRPIILYNRLTLGQSLSLEAFLIATISGLTNIVKPKIDFDFLEHLRYMHYFSLCARYGIVECEEIPIIELEIETL